MGCEELDVPRTQEEVFEHGVVGEEDMGRVRLHLLAAELLVGQQCLTGMEGLEVPLGVFCRVLGLPGVAPEGDLGDVGQECSEPLELVVGESVHRV